LLGARTDIPELLASFDVFALSSSTEGMSIALLEAMAAGCPIVVTAVGGNTELIEHEATGLVVPPDDEPAMRSAIQRLLDDRVLAARLGAAAQARAREKYSLDAMTRRYEELWRRLASSVTLSGAKDLATCQQDSSLRSE
jgi:glycosyltransferase involved in cell wall biosynthesis